jgi:hypothetical protein
LALATRMPSRVRRRMRSASNSATIASMLNSSRPTGSVGSWIEPPRLSLTALRVRSSRISRASGSEPVELRHHQGVTLAAGGQRLTKAGTVAVGTGQAVVDVDPVAAHAERHQRFALRGQVLLVGGHAGIADEQRRHEVLLVIEPAHPAGATSPVPSERSAVSGRQRFSTKPPLPHRTVPHVVRPRPRRVRLARRSARPYALRC